MLVCEAVLCAHDTAARDLELRHCVLDLLCGAGCAPFDGLCVEFSALLGGDGFDTGRAILVVEVLKVEIHCLNGSLVDAGAERAERDIVAVLGLEQAVGLEGCGLVARAGVLAAGHGVGGVQVAAVARLNLELRVAALEDVDVCSQNRKHGGVCGGEVVEPGLADDGLAALFAVEAHPAGERLTDHVVGCAVTVLGQAAESRVAVAADVGDDELGVHLEQLLVTDAELFEPNHVLHEHVGFLDQAEEQLLDLGMLQVQLKGKRELVAAVLCPGGADGLAVLFCKRSEDTERVADAGAFDVDDLCAEVGKQRGCVRHCDQRAGIDHAHACKRTVLRDDLFTFAHLNNLLL